MKNNFKIFCIFAALCFFSALADAQSRTRLTIYGVKGPSSVALIRLFEQPPLSADYEIKLEALSQADLLAALFISGEAKIGILPPNMAAKIASTGRKIQIAAVTGNGMLSLLSGDPSVRTIDHLKGKTLEVAGQGATPDFVIRKILLSRGLVPGRDVQLGYALAYPEIALALAAGRVKFALLPEPFATMALTNNPGLFAVEDIQNEWAKIHQKNRSGAGINAADNYPMTVLAVDTTFAEANRNLITKILESVEESIKWVQANPGEAGALAEKHELGLRAAVLREAIPKSNYNFIPLPQARSALEDLFAAFLEFAPESIGGALPKDDFYYNSGMR